MVSSSFLVAAIAVFSVSLTSASANPVEARAPVATATPSVEGCFDSLSSFTFGATNDWQSSGSCQDTCVAKNKPVIAINGTDCWCSDTLPPKSAKVDDTKCDKICPGWPSVMCGSGADYFSAWNDGLVTNIKNAGDNADDVKSESESSSSSSSTAAAKSTTAPTQTQTDTKPAVVTIGGKTIVVTQTGEVQAAASSASAAAAAAGESSGPNKAGIAAGVVVGVVVIAAAAGGLWFFMRSKKRRQVEEEHKRQAAINAFVKTGGNTEVSSFDTRLEPAIMRRMSAGSIADNHDYSRRILKVTNA